MAKTHGYAPVNGLQMFYEIDGEGEPLVFIRRHLAVADVHAVPALLIFGAALVSPLGALASAPNALVLRSLAPCSAHLRVGVGVGHRGHAGGVHVPLW